MTVFGYPDPPTTAPRALRRLSHSPVVPTTYLSRDVDLEAVEAEAAAAVRRGYEEGYADGLARAAAEATGRQQEESQRVAAALAALSHAVTATEESERRLRREIEAAAPKLAFSLLETLLGRELVLAATPGRDAITRVLALDEGLEPATVRLNPADVETLEALDLGRVLNVVADPSVESGGAVVEIGRAVLDGQLRSALERVRQVLLGSDAPEEASDDRAA